MALCTLALAARGICGVVAALIAQLRGSRARSSVALRLLLGPLGLFLTAGSDKPRYQAPAPSYAEQNALARGILHQSDVLREDD